MARNRRGGHSLGSLGPIGTDIPDHCGSTYANTIRLLAGVRGLAVLRSVALRSLCNPNWVGLRGSLECWRGTIGRRCGGAATALRWHSQRLGCRYLPRLCQQTGTSGNQAQTTVGDPCHVANSSREAVNGISRASLRSPRAFAVLALSVCVGNLVEVRKIPLPRFLV